MDESRFLTKTKSVGDRLQEVRESIRRACVRAGRRPEEVTIVAVSKQFSLKAMYEAYEAGVRHFGESRAGELEDKVTQWSASDDGVTWHMVGHLQRNKARRVVEHAELFHALDSIRLARRLDRVGEDMHRPVRCLVQVNVSGEESKFGFEPSSLGEKLESIREMKNLQVEGLMTIAELVADPEQVRPQFRLLRELFDRYRRPADKGPEMSILSMGMSDDYPVAIEEGATHVRIGRAIFGERD